MAGFDHQVLTDVGWDALADALSSKKLTFTHLSAGDGTVTGGDAQMQGMTALIHETMDFPITSSSDDGQGQITLIGTLTNSALAPGSGFYWRELGVIATIDNGPEILYSVSNAGATADFIPDNASPKVIETIQIVVKIDRGVNPTINVVDLGTVTAQNIGAATVGAGWFRDKIGSILNFKRLISGLGLSVTEASDTITIGQKLISQNLDCYVTLGANDVFPNFSSISNAIKYLKQFSILVNVTVNVWVSAGIWNQNNQTTYLDHYDGPRINIIGTTSATRNITSHVGTTGSPGNYTSTFNVDNTSDISVGDWVLAETSGSALLRGVFKVTAKTAGSVSVANRFSQAWPGAGTAITGSMTAMKTVINCIAGTGIAVGPVGNGIGLLKGIMLTGGLVPNQWGIVVNSVPATLDTIGVTNFIGTGGDGGGIVAANNTGVITGTHIHAANCDNGLHCSGGGQAFWNQASASFGRIGFRANLNGQVTINDGIAGDNSTGVSIGNQSYLSPIICYVNYNKTYGVYLSGLCYGIIPYGGTLSTSANNANNDLILSVLSSFARGGATLSYGGSNVTRNVLSADGCYLSY